MAIDMVQLKADALKQLTEIGTDVRKDIWSAQHKAFLEQMAADVAGLTVKLLNEQDASKKARYRRSLDLIANHVAVMAFSRLNVVEQRVGDILLALLEKVGSFVITTLLAKFGIKDPADRG